MPSSHTRDRFVRPLPRVTRPVRARRRRPTPLPTLVPTTKWGRYLHRLAWLFMGERL